ncbi:unnamed protein product, partial [Chrysoparadoxa australica]
SAASTPAPAAAGGFSFGAPAAAATSTSTALTVGAASDPAPAATSGAPPAPTTAASTGFGFGAPAPAAGADATAPAPAQPAAAGFKLGAGAPAPAAAGSGAAGLAVTPAPALGLSLPASATPVEHAELEKVEFSSEKYWRTLNSQEAYAHLQRCEVTAEQVELMLGPDSDQAKRVKQLFSYHKPPSQASAAKLASGMVELYPGEKETPVPGQQREQSFCGAISWLVDLDELQSVQLLHAFLRQLPQPSAFAFNFESPALLFKVRDFYYAERLGQLRLLQELL